MARPSKLTRELIDQFHGVAQTAITIEEASDELGIDRDTFARWSDKGRADSDAGRDSLAAEFYGIASRARVTRKRKVTSALFAAAMSGDVRAMQIWLTLVEKEAPTQKIEHSGGVDIATLARLADAE